MSSNLSCSRTAYGDKNQMTPNNKIKYTQINHFRKTTKYSNIQNIDSLKCLKLHDNTPDNTVMADEYAEIVASLSKAAKKVLSPTSDLNISQHLSKYLILSK